MRVSQMSLTSVRISSALGMLSDALQKHRNFSFKGRGHIHQAHNSTEGCISVDYLIVYDSLV